MKRIKKEQMRGEPFVCSAALSALTGSISMMALYRGAGREISGLKARQKETPSCGQNAVAARTQR